MTLTDNDIERLNKKGLKLIGSNGEVVTIKRQNPIPQPPITVPKNSKSEIDYLRAISQLLGQLVYKPDPQPPKLEPPNITVEPTPVVVNPTPIQAPPKPITKWKFVLTKDHMGRTTEIIATAFD